MNAPEVWGPDRVDELLEAYRKSGGDDDLTIDELLTACHERGGTVLAVEGAGVVALAVGRGASGGLVASVRLLIPADESVEPIAELLSVAEDWSATRSVDRIVLHGELPFALWPGVPEQSPLAATALRRGWESSSSWSSFRVPVAFRADPPASVVVRRAVRDEDVALVLVAASARWPRRSDEIARALEHGTCHVAIEERDDEAVVVGLGTHSIARAGWSGPLVVIEEARRRGIGRALLGQICRDLMIAEFPHLIVGDATEPMAQSFLESIGAEPEVSWVGVERRFDR